MPMNPYKYLVLLLIPLTAIPGFIWHGYLTFLTPFCCFVLLPFAELLPVTLNFRDTNKTSNPNTFRFITYFFSFVVLLFILIGCMDSGSVFFIKTEFAGLLLSVGVINGIIGFTLAHEFIHKHGLFEKMLGGALLAGSNYLHYSIEHVYGHHVNACTFHDPNSARLGESFYHFLLRSVAGSYKNAWRIENKRLRKKCIPFYSIHNKMLVFQLIGLTLLLTIFLVFGKPALLFFVGQSFIAIVIHQMANYIQHYGLNRRYINDQHEKLNAHHAWSIPGKCKIIDLFHVENHADHHLHAATPFYKLVSKDDSPKLPANYPTMVLLSLFPPLWFKIIHRHISTI